MWCKLYATKVSLFVFMLNLPIGLIMLGKQKLFKTIAVVAMFGLVVTTFISIGVSSIM